MPPLPRPAPALLAAALAAAPLHAQRPVEPFDAAGRYAVSGFEAQLTGSLNGGRDLFLSFGRMRAGGPGGAWSWRAEVGAGVTLGEEPVDRLLAGPRVTLARALPGQHFSVGRGVRAEPYLLVAARGLGVVDLRGMGEEWGAAPAAAAGIGVRLMEDAWEIDLATVEVTVERRFGAHGGATELFVRLGRAVPLPRTSRR